MSFTNKKKIYIYYPEKVITGQKSDGISFNEPIEMHYFDRVNKKGLQVPGAQGSEEILAQSISLSTLPNVPILPLN